MRTRLIGLLLGTVVWALGMGMSVMMAGDAPAAAWASGTEDDLPGRGTMAPDFTLTRADGQGTMRLSSLRGKPVVLTFWAFWCDTWREVRSGYRALRDANVPATLIAVAVDPTRVELLGQTDDAPLPFYPVLIDADRAVSGQYNVRAVPTVIVLDARGRIRYRTRGWPGLRPLVAAVTQAVTMP